jgi:hypothetical protein
VKGRVVTLWAKTVGVWALLFFVIGIPLDLLLQAGGEVDPNAANGVVFVAAGIAFWGAWRYRRRRLSDTSPEPADGKLPPPPLGT